ncbi:unnamed protein product [Moneuplotes crassus]|uniref:AP2/ERF domain-containing protein n=1 Tax=Euplotes crassus TaxID=5936 RepID=A0AAD2D6T9_EUPCR|nr:unnamed protein product [Moneuplotes crassus]
MLIIFMNLSNFSPCPVTSKWNGALTGDFKGLLYQLGQIYCVCPSVEQTLPRLNRFGSYQDLQSCSYPSNLKSSCDTNPSVQQEQTDSLSIEKARESQKFEDIKSDSPERVSLPETGESPNDSQKSEVIKKRRRRSTKLEIKSKLARVRAQILKRGISAFHRSPKKARGNLSCNSNRRSRYIGVSKNNAHWQALINIKRTKKYIDIFACEQEAARTYDLYAIALKGVKAGLNFDYTAEEMIAMIDNYLKHKRVEISS